MQWSNTTTKSGNSNIHFDPDHVTIPVVDNSTHGSSRANLKRSSSSIRETDNPEYYKNFGATVRNIANSTGTRPSTIRKPGSTVLRHVFKPSARFNDREMDLNFNIGESPMNQKHARGPENQHVEGTRGLQSDIFEAQLDLDVDDLNSSDKDIESESSVEESEFQMHQENARDVDLLQKQKRINQQQRAVEIEELELERQREKERLRRRVERERELKNQRELELQQLKEKERAERELAERKAEILRLNKEIELEEKRLNSRRIELQNLRMRQSVTTNNINETSQREQVGKKTVDTSPGHADSRKNIFHDPARTTNSIPTKSNLNNSKLTLNDDDSDMRQVTDALIDRIYEFNDARVKNLLPISPYTRKRSREYSTEDRTNTSAEQQFEDLDHPNASKRVSSTQSRTSQFQGSPRTHSRTASIKDVSDDGNSANVQMSGMFEASGSSSKAKRISPNYARWSEDQWRQFVESLKTALKKSSTGPTSALILLNELSRSFPEEMKNMHLDELVARMKAYFRHSQNHN